MATTKRKLLESGDDTAAVSKGGKRAVSATRKEHRFVNDGENYRSIWCPLNNYRKANVQNMYIVSMDLNSPPASPPPRAQPAPLPSPSPSVGLTTSASAPHQLLVSVYHVSPSILFFSSRGIMSSGIMRINLSERKSGLSSFHAGHLSFTHLVKSCLIAL